MTVGVVLQPHGMGVFKGKQGFLQRYDGEWAMGHKQGRGVAVFDNGDKYEGEFRENTVRATQHVPQVTKCLFPFSYALSHVQPTAVFWFGQIHIRERNNFGGAMGQKHARGTVHCHSTRQDGVEFRRRLCRLDRGTFPCPVANSHFRRRSFGSVQ